MDKLLYKTRKIDLKSIFRVLYKKIFIFCIQKHFVKSIMYVKKYYIMYL